METQHGQLKALSQKEIDEILDHSTHVHLGVYRSGEAYVVPITYVLDGDFIYGHSRLEKVTGRAEGD